MPETTEQTNALAEALELGADFAAAILFRAQWPYDDSDWPDVRRDAEKVRDTLNAARVLASSPPVGGERHTYEPCATCGEQPTGWFAFADETVLYCGQNPGESQNYHLYTARDHSEVVFDFLHNHLYGAIECECVILPDKNLLCSPHQMIDDFLNGRWVHPTTEGHDG